jgi:ABC-type nitrate/sulfonate/bicarbonate transport system substrate-binding protein
MRGSAALAGAGLLAACGEGSAPVAGAAAAVAEPIDITVPRSPACALALIAQARRLWGEAGANLVVAGDDATLVRGFNSGLVEFGAMTLERFLFWRSGGSRLQLAAWASREGKSGASLVYAVREDMPDQAAQLDRFISGLKGADAWMLTHGAEAAALVAEQIGAPVDAASLAGQIAGTEANRALLAATAGGESQSMKVMRPVDEAMREDGSAGHQAFLPDIIAAGAAAAWAR